MGRREKRNESEEKNDVALFFPESKEMQRIRRRMERRKRTQRETRREMAAKDRHEK